MGQNSLKCKQCGAILNQSSKLVEHIMNEHPESPEAQKINFGRAQRSWKGT